ncbi:MAG: hypothetical protein QM504_09150 [Pseudomonadota bacterium]
MNYPEFFDSIAPIRLYDPLAEFLGSFSDGLIEFSYTDVVKAAGHSCPTVAGAYLMCQQGLTLLYPEQLPVRGQLKVEFKETLEEGVAGVTASVFTHITGATDKSGFKGINNNFIRHSLMAYECPITSSVRLSRIDNNKAIELVYNPQIIPASAEQQDLIQLILNNKASDEQKIRFACLWQVRVEKILCGSFFDNGILTIKI